MSINFDEAAAIAFKWLYEADDPLGVEKILLKNATIEKDNYWVFFYNSKEYVETGNQSYLLAGNSPLIIDKIYGNVYETGTANPVKFYMDVFEQKELPLILKKKAL